MISNYKEYCILESKKSQQDFFKKVDKLVKEYGTLTKDDDNRIEYSIKTVAGDYKISLHKSDFEDKSKVYSIFGRFEDTEAAHKNKFIDTPNTGKVNFHTNTAEEALTKLKTFLEKIKK